MNSKELVELCKQFSQITGKITLKEEELEEVKLSLRNLKESEQKQQQKFLGCVSVLNHIKVVKISATQVMIVERIDEDSCEINVEEVVCADESLPGTNINYSSR